ncbi:TRAP transporter substrate-binding protein [Acidovorax sp. NCPPB 3576]|uniref:TRAP transporter substrate-binding protein n=1 Tax=Acidovorax sp. NCPPB 3576 TaxID=2940488 RepID=UPI00234A3373|nr:TRAP transporter substrate-binding protein [Acidovorax sp. NCPPB 3576]WCM88130.1 TRAP transporter substrate-binding protein [Acidovorax sp. NCPPB 3576]
MKRRSWCALFMALGSFALPGGVSAQTRWTLATGYLPEVFHTVNLQQFAKDVNERTKGALVIDVRPDNSVAKLSEIAGQVRAGKIAAGEVLLSSLAADTKLAGADAIPFIVDTYDDALRLWKAQRPVLQEALDRQGLVPLYAVPWPAQGLFTTRSIRHVSDLRGAKMRSYSPSTVRIAQLMGATPVDVPAKGINQAVLDRQIDTLFTSPVTGVENKVWDLPIKYFYNVHAWYPKNLVLVNKAQWLALPEGTRKIVEEAAAQAQVRGWNASSAASTASIAELARNGIKLETPDFELRRELRRLGEQFSLEYIRDTGADGNRMMIPYFSGENAAAAPKAQ